MLNIVIEIRKNGKEGGRGGGEKKRGSEEGGRIERREGERERNKNGEGKTFWGHGFLGTKTKGELKKSHLFYP